MDTYKDVCTYYTLHVREDNYGNTILDTSLRELMKKCLDFTLNQYLQDGRE